MGLVPGHKTALLCAGIVLAACAAPTVPEYPPLDDAIAHVQLADPLASIAEATLGVPLTPEKMRGRDRCLFNGSSQRFECPLQASGTLAYSRSYQLLGPGGVPVAEWGPGVASIRMVTRVTGTVSTTQGTFSVERTDESTLGDLRELRQTLRGSATLSWRLGESTWFGRRDTELQVLSRARMPGKFPTGTIALTARLDDPAQQRSASMTFDGSSVVSMLLSVDGKASVSCKLDLNAPDAATACR